MSFKRYNQRLLFGADMELREFLRIDDICSTLKQDIVPLIDPSDFAEMYSEGGRPPISPVVLTAVTLLQFLEGLSDRAAAFNLRYRIDWKIAMGLEMKDEGIHHSSLSRFRDRLAENDKASYAFDRILAHLGKKGLVKSGGKQRIDSTHVIAKVRELTRHELICETLRLFCEEAGRTKIRSESVIEIVSKYSEKQSTYRLSDQEKRESLHSAAAAMKELIAWVETTSVLQKLRSNASFLTLKVVFEQNFKETNDSSAVATLELIPIATGRGHICNPHDTEARFSNKGGKGWLGYKAQVAETVPEDGGVGFITYVDVNEATDFDGDVVEEYLAEQQAQGITPTKVYADTHYNTAQNIEHASSVGSALRGPVIPLPATETTKEKNRGFKANLKKRQIVCPTGKKSVHFANHRGGKVYGSFSNLDCRPCSKRVICQPAPRGKCILMHPTNELLTKRRAEMATVKFKKEMYQRNGIEGTISGLVRGQGLRRSRYCGKAKTRIQIKFGGASANIKRLHRYYEIERQN